MSSSNILARIRWTREKISDSRMGETHCEEIMLEDSTKIELLLTGKLWNKTAPKLIFVSLSSPIGYFRCRPCSWLNICWAYGRQNKIRFIRKILIANKKPKENIKYISNGKKILITAWIYRPLVYVNRPAISCYKFFFFVRCAKHDAEIGVLNLSA